MEADGAVDAQNAPTVPWKTLCVFHELPQGLSNQITHEKPRKAPKWRWETRIDPSFSVLNSKVDRHETSFRALLDKDSVQGYQEQLKESVDGMSWWKRNVFATDERRQKEKDITSIGAIRADSLDNVRLNIAHWSQDLAGRDAGQEQSVVYYRENAGKGNVKAYYTSDLQLEQIVAPN